MKKLLRSLQLRRLWIKFGILWTGAALVGLTAVGYAWLIDFGYALFSKLPSFWFTLLLTPFIGAVCVYLTRRFFAGAEGSGIPQVIATLNAMPSRPLLSLKLAAGKIALSFLAILGGFTLGREGPTVQVGAALMLSLRGLYPRATPVLQRQLILVGAAAGLAAAFNTPLAGIVFAIEELTRKFEYRTSGTLLITIILSGVVALAINGNYNYFGTIHASISSVTKMIVVICTSGITMGLMGACFCWIVLNPTRWMPAGVLRLRQQKPVIFAAVCGLLVACVGLVSLGTTYGSGYHEARGLLEGREALSLFYPVLKMLSMIGSFLSGIPGGIFAPSLSIGAGFGNVLYTVFPSIDLPVLIALAMVGYLAAVTQSPITAFVIVMEMIDGHTLVLPLMATALIASQVAKLLVPPFYEALAQRYMH